MYPPDDSPETVHSSVSACRRGKASAAANDPQKSPIIDTDHRPHAMQTSHARQPLLLALLVATIIAFAVSGWRPYDRLTWFMEVAPALIALPLMIVTRDRYPLTTLLYVLIFLHALVLMGGGAYTYARVPVGFWVQEWFGLARNPYDKLGHFMQGFVPALAAREVLLRGGFVRGTRMTAFLCVCVALAVSAAYELVEWWAALALGQGADEFLGTQGDPWDTPSAMFLALIGSTVAPATLPRVHARQLRQLGTIPAP